MIKQFAASVLAALTLGGAAVANGPSQSEVDRHFDLMQTAANIGTEVYINHKVCGDNPGVNGFYYPGYNVLVICQDNATEFNGQQVAWTYNDLDTIRHEVQHMVQDCVAGYDNAELNRVFSESKNLVAFASDAIGVETIERIIEVYTERGANQHVVGLEIEAFSVAAAISPETIGEALTSTCSID